MEKRRLVGERVHRPRRPSGIAFGRRGVPKQPTRWGSRLGNRRYDSHFVTSQTPVSVHEVDFSWFES
jgi:hypothetical protein